MPVSVFKRSRGRTEQLDIQEAYNIWNWLRIRYNSLETLLANNLKDMCYNYKMQIVTVPIRLGREKAFKLFAGMAYSIYIFSAIGILSGLLPVWAVLVDIIDIRQPSLRHRDISCRLPLLAYLNRR